MRRTKEAIEMTISASSMSTTQPESSASSFAPADSQGVSLPAPTNPRIQAFLDERKIRMEREKKEHDAKVKAERAAAHAARETELAKDAPLDPRKEANRKYAAAQSERQKELRKERERILRRVEDDKVARREREALRKEQARATAMIEDETSAVASPMFSKQPGATRSAQCNLQVRLFDGSMIRSRFPSNQTLRNDVRAWVDEQRGDEDIPYTFKQVLTPMPNRTIGDSEEDGSLQDIGFCPSATLILVEVKDFTPAYQGGATGLVRSGVATGYGLVSSGVGLVTSALGGLFGGATAPPAAERTPTSNTRSVRNQTSTEGQEFYNGNSVRLIFIENPLYCLSGEHVP